jgi:squalene-hopene/tetraprenyl-beta-curcumene cyclase
MMIKRSLGLLVLTLALVACDGGGSADETSNQPENSSQAIVAAYDRGLDFLKAAAPGGNFHQDPGLTGLAAATFHERPGGLREEDREFVKGLTDFVLSFQKEDGGIYAKQLANYTTCCAIMALSGIDDPACVDAVAKAAEFLKTLQAPSGGIGYSEKNPGVADLSNTQFAIESLRLAGVKPDDKVVSETLRFLQSVQNRSESNNATYELEDGRIVVAGDDGGAYYKPGESKAGLRELPDGRVELRSYGSMTYALLKCYLLAGLTAEDPRVKAAVKWVRNHYTLEENPGFQDAKDPNASLQGLYYYYLTMAKALDLLDIKVVKDVDGLEHEWRVELGDKLTSQQRKDGSWVNEHSGRWMEDIPVVATSFALIALSRCAP